jgi:hypothetical protein
MSSFSNTLKPLTFVSVEGFWEKPIHDARVAEAAKKLNEHPQAFAIATATHAPAPCTSFTNRPLGQYTAQKLIEDYKIDPARILPAYLFPQKTTYTIIDAYSNAMMIGWLCSGLSARSEIIHISLYPVSAGFRAQQERIVLLNARSTKALEKLSIKVTIYPASNMKSFKPVSAEDQEEMQKLAALKKPGSVIDTGTWQGNSGIPRSFDNIDAIKSEIALAVEAIFGKQISRSALFELSDMERLLLTLVWNVKANTGANYNLDALYKMACHYFVEATNTDLPLAKDKLIAKGLLN